MDLYSHNALVSNLNSHWVQGAWKWHIETNVRAFFFLWRSQKSLESSEKVTVVFSPWLWLGHMVNWSSQNQLNQAPSGWCNLQVNWGSQNQLNQAQSGWCNLQVQITCHARNCVFSPLALPVNSSPDQHSRFANMVCSCIILSSNTVWKQFWCYVMMKGLKAAVSVNTADAEKWMSGVS